MTGLKTFLPNKLLAVSFYLFTIGLAMYNTTATAQQDRYIVYDVKDGLSQNSVHAITRDKDGMVWLGTQDGLNSFDGTHFISYKHLEEDSTSISDQFVLSIKEDAAGNLWVGTRNGLNFFNKRSKTFKRFYLDKKEQHFFQSNYDKFYVQADNNIIIKREGLHLLYPATGEIISLQKDNADVIDWLVLPNYNCWLFSKSKGILFYPDIRKPHHIVKGKLNKPVALGRDYFLSVPLNDSVFCLYNFLESKEIYFFNTRSARLDGSIDYPGTGTYLSFIKDKLVLCTTTGIYEKKPGLNSTWKPIKTSADNGLPPGVFLSAYYDKEGNTWFGTAGSGLAVTNPGFNYFTAIPTPVAKDRVTGICMAGSDLFISTHSGLFSIRDFNNNAGKLFTTVIKGANVTAISSNKEGNVWMALYNEGLQLVSRTGKVIRKITLPERAYKSTILNLAIDRQDRLLVSTTYGMYIVYPVQNNQPVKIDTAINNQLSGNYYMSAYEDRANNIWLAGNMGVDVINEKLQLIQSFNSNTDTQSFLKRSIITSVTQDMDGAMWIATIRNGVYKYHNKKFTHYTHTSGLSSDIAYNVICDNNNRIWVTTSSGLNIFDHSQNSFKPIAAFDGVPKTSFTFGSILKHNEFLIIGGTGSLLVCNADRYVIKKGQLTAFISDVKINGQSIDIISNEFTLEPDNKLIRFEFAYAPAFYSGNVVYQYRLKGADSNWINLTPGINAISYTGLPYKNLSMEVRAAGSINNLNNAAVFSLQIKSKAPFYKTTFFAIAVAAIGIFIVSMIVINYNKQKYKKQLAVLKVEKELQKERFRIGRDLHDNIGAYTSALIAGLNRIKSTDSNDKENITDLKDYGANIMGLLRETIWMLNAAEITVTAFTDRFINYAMRINKNYPATDFTFSEAIENDKKLEPTTMLNLFRILQEALQNACKHSEANRISFSVSSKKVLEFTITDNGRGFTGEGKQNHYGINNMKQRASEAGFICSIQSNREGTSVYITENTANA